MQISLRRIRVRIQHFSQPPIEAVTGAVESMLRDNLFARHVDITAETTRPDACVLRMDQFFDSVMQGACDMYADAAPDLDFTACVAPIFIQYEERRRSAPFNLVAIAARNAGGKQWLLSQFVGNKRVPKPLVVALAAAANDVLQQRGALQNDASEIELEHATALVTLIAAGIDYAVDSCVGTMTFN